MFIDFQTEMEVSYFPEGGSITDYVCDIFGTKVGVSVTRAMKYRGEYTEEDATNLLTKKLKGTYILHKHVIGGTGFTLEKGWGRKGRLGFIFFYCHDKQITYHIWLLWT